jgi:hypothetical protein
VRKRERSAPPAGRAVHNAASRERRLNQRILQPSLSTPVVGIKKMSRRGRAPDDFPENR